MGWGIFSSLVVRSLLKGGGWGIGTRMGDNFVVRGFLAVLIFMDERG